MKVMAKGNEPCCTPPFQLNEQKQSQKISIQFPRTVDINFKSYLNTQVDSLMLMIKSKNALLTSVKR